jgi:ATP-dependent Clp protease ATP-binding subunit ClpB
VFNALLQVLDDGRMTDGQGRTVDFKNALIIMTSNLGAEHLVAHSGEDVEAARDAVMTEVRARFRPEFLNRIDETILFRRLAPEHMARIVDIQVDRLAKLLADRRITIELDDKARELLSKEGYDPAYGARPLKRVIQKRLQDPLAKLILEGQLQDGETVKVSAEGDELTLNGYAAAPGAPPGATVN